MAAVHELSVRRAEIELLDETNWRVWNSRFKAFAVKKKFADALWPKAAGPVADGVDEAVLAEIRLNVSSDYLVLIEDCKTAKEAWKVLQDLNTSKLRGRKMHLLRQLVTLRMENSDTPTTLFAKFKKLRNELESLGEKLSEDLMITLFTKAILDKTSNEAYREVVSRIEDSTEQLTLQQVAERLIVASMKSREQDDIGRATISVGAVSSCVSRGQQNPQQQQQSRRDPRERDLSKVRCHACDEFGHIARNCPWKKELQQEQEQGPARGQGQKRGERQWVGAVCFPSSKDYVIIMD